MLLSKPLIVETPSADKKLVVYELAAFLYDRKRKTLTVQVPGNTFEIDGVAVDEAERILEFVERHVVRPAQEPRVEESET